MNKQQALNALEYAEDVTELMEVAEGLLIDKTNNRNGRVWYQDEVFYYDYWETVCNCCGEDAPTQATITLDKVLEELEIQNIGFI